jgi:hypothetical protein
VQLHKFLIDLEQNGERNRGLCILKSRGMEHSNQIRVLKSQFETEEEKLHSIINKEKALDEALETGKTKVAQSRATDKR